MEEPAQETAPESSLAVTAPDPSVGDMIASWQRGLLAGTGGASNREAYEADIASVSARLAVIRSYLLPVARKRLRSDNAEIAALDGSARDAERTLRGLQGTLHGQAAYNARGSVESLHSSLTELMVSVTAAESALVRRLEKILTPRQAGELVKRLTGAQNHLPTRPHPYTPHPPGLARLFFRASAASDRIMDTMDGRVLAKRPRDHPINPPTKGTAA